MKLVQAVIRPEKASDLLEAFVNNGFPAATRMSVLGRGKQRGLKVGEVYYDEIPKETIMVVVENEEANELIKIIKNVCRTGKTGAYGDGKIFILDVERAITISSGSESL